MIRSRPPEVEVAKVWEVLVRPLREVIPPPDEKPSVEVATQAKPPGAVVEAWSK